MRYLVGCRPVWVMVAAMYHRWIVLRGRWLMARLAARGKDLFLMRTTKIPDGDREIINRIEVELRYKNNGNLLRRTRTFFKPGFLSTGKNFYSTGWQLEARGLPQTAEELIGMFRDVGFDLVKISGDIEEEEEAVSDTQEPPRLKLVSND